MDTWQRDREITSYRLNKDMVPCPHMDTWQRDRELQEHTGLAVLGVLGGGRGGMGPMRHLCYYMTLYDI